MGIHFSDLDGSMEPSMQKIPFKSESLQAPQEPENPSRYSYSQTPPRPNLTSIYFGCMLSCHENVGDAMLRHAKFTTEQMESEVKFAENEETLRKIRKKRKIERTCLHLFNEEMKNLRKLFRIHAKMTES